MTRSTSSVVLCAVLPAALLPAPAAVAAPAPGPGALSHFGLARKDCLGTARTTARKAWFTEAGGVLSDVYAPVIDNTNVETLQFAVTDGRTFTVLQARDMTYTVRTSAGGMACEVTSTPRSGRYRLVTEYLPDPRAPGSSSGPGWTRCGGPATTSRSTCGSTRASTATAAVARRTAAG